MALADANFVHENVTDVEVQFTDGTAKVIHDVWKVIIQGQCEYLYVMQNASGEAEHLGDDYVFPFRNIKEFKMVRSTHNQT